MAYLLSKFHPFGSFLCLSALVASSFATKALRHKEGCANLKILRDPLTIESGYSRIHSARITQMRILFN